MLGAASVALAALAQAQPVGKPIPAAAADSIVAGRLLVAAKAGMPDKALEALAREHGAKGVRAAGQGTLRYIDVHEGAERTVLARLDRHPHLRFVELDRRVPPSLVVNDPYMGSAWHLPRIGTPAAWDSTLGQGIVIAVLDSGIDASHPEFAGRLVAGWNLYGNNADTSDVHGHGTAVAGVLAAATNNGQGVAGVAGAARIMPLRISDTTGWASYSTMAQGLVWAADRGARVANLSYVAAGSAAVRDAASYFKGKGGLVTSSAGNYGTDAGIAATTSMIPVSATGPTDALAGWSSWGAHVALTAPGEGIYTTNAGGGYGAWSGTSFSSPVTAGVVALMMSARPTLSASTIEMLLYQSALDLGSAGRDPLYGHGRVQAAAAVAAAMAAVVPTVDTQAPSASISAPMGGTVSGLVGVNVVAADNVGVVRVDLLAGSQVVASDTNAPFGFVWDSSTRPNGSVGLVARAYDAAGNNASSAAVTVQVSNAAISDSVPPLVTITSPAAGAVLKVGNIGLRASASDDRGVVSVRVLVDGVEQQQQLAGASLSTNWNARKATLGNHTITVIASDAAGNQGSRAVVVTLVK